MLSDDLRRWFDDELWRCDDGTVATRYTSPIPPEELLCDAPTAIWPALMPCDFLPLIGNQMGDWLCVRLDDDDRAHQIIQWYHGGGDWIPWGDSLAEAIFFDSVRSRLPGSQRDHAIAAASPSQQPAGPSANQITRWAEHQLVDRSVASLDGLAGSELAQAMLQRGLSRPAVLCQLAIDALENTLLDPASVQAWPIEDPAKVQRGLFDNRLIPDESLQQSKPEGISQAEFLAQQDWRELESIASQATRVAPELAWGWDLLGYARERRKAIDEAISAYRQGLGCSIFTDQTVRVRTHGFSGEGQKFSAARLQQLHFTPDDRAERDYFELLCQSNDDDRRDRVREFFSDRARQAHGAAAHDLWKRAGWDLGAEPMAAFAELLEQVAAAAERAGRRAQAVLAQTHRECFRDRYRL